MIYTLRHETRYQYAKPVDLAAHLLHLTPLTLPWQRVIDTKLTSTPPPSRLRSATDCFGNTASWLFLDAPHERFAAVLDATVEVAAPPPPDAGATLPWEQVVALAAGPAGHAAAEFAYASPMIIPFAAAREYVAPSFPPGRPIFAALMDLTVRFKREFAFRAGVTEIGTPLARVLAQRAGVCQDFSHLMIAGLRAMGLPARYASGYIRTLPPPGRAARRGADQSHAWVSGWMGPEHGWIDVDPTNGIVIADEHVVLAYGRDFSDISPLSGIILGGGAHSVRVGVDLEPAA